MRMRNHVPKEIKRNRHKEIKKMADQKYHDFLQLFDNQVQEVLWERDAEVVPISQKKLQPYSDLFLWKGYTKSYVKVQSQSRRILFNHITPAKFTWTKDILYGNLLE